MDLHLDESEVELLRDVLNRAWREAKYEISDTDNASFKRDLRATNDRLKDLLDQLGGPLPN